MQLGFGFSYEYLSKQEGLAALDKIFIEFIAEHNRALHFTLIQYRSFPINVSNAQYSNLLIAIASLVDDFFSQLFNIERQIDKIRQTAQNFDIIYECKRKFVQRLAVKRYSIDQVDEIDFNRVTQLLLPLCAGQITQQRFANNVLKWLQAPIKYSKHIDLAAKYAAYMVYKGSKLCLFDLPKINDSNLPSEKEIAAISHPRLDFDYSAGEINIENALNHTHYCIYCHHQNKDSCSTGLKSATGKIDQNKSGCPLKQKISEMNQVKAAGFEIAALAIIVIDNPLLAATGHRICNDCMNSCIYQKQEPVNVPLVESNILSNILKLPYGLEIYLLLTRWNPVNIYCPLPKPLTGYNVLVAGLGPAGFAISYYLLREGHNVLAIDGLKISPILISRPIKYWHQYKQRALARVPQGFGGVSEYGITSRWDKNNLLIIRLILERNNNFKLYGNIMLGANITKQQVHELGFDYMALCTGASKPKLPVITNFLAKGVRTAADFLMMLQNQGSFLEQSISSLTIRMPVAVIGCGLTAVDSAVETLNYYPTQVKKFLKHYHHLVAKFGTFYVEKNWTSEDRAIAHEFIEHANLFRQLKDKKKIREVITTQLGGASIYYRGEIKDSSAFILNRQEVAQAMAAGVRFIPNTIISKINIDQFGHVISIDCTDKTYVAKSILMAIGTDNTAPQKQQLEVVPFSYFGDSNPQYAGSVVKAIASAKEGYSKISDHLIDKKPSNSQNWPQLSKKLDHLLISTIAKINYLTANITELIIHSPLAAKNFQPGQFFRLQNYSADLAKIIQPIALCGGYLDYPLNEDHLSLIIHGAGRSSSLCKNLSIGERIALMGPTGMQFIIPKNKYLIFIAEGISNARLLSISNAAKNQGCKVLYIAGYEKSSDLFHQNMIEKSADTVIWCSKTDIIIKKREQDFSITGDVLDALKHYNFDLLPFPDQIICSTSIEKTNAIKNLRDQIFPNATLKFTTNSLMQCMMRGICGQCVEATVNDKSYIFSCNCQIQDASIIDLDLSKSRSEQDALQKKLIALL
ncbi:MAG: 2-polyprenylphenol hydroxylase [Rickettsiaceae bacterium]|nr:MAG: 2-polyprenylphenol hydroxylase [Rickettsiaceae bacterium]